MSRPVLHAALDLLDRQIIDRDELPVGKVDDVELEHAGDGSARLAALLVGPQAYGQRLGGRLGTWIASAAARLAGTDEPIRIPVEAVDDFDVSIKLKVAVGEIDRAERVDRWLREHLIQRIPGANRATE